MSVLRPASRTGSAELPLHGGHAPPWLFQRMVLLAGEMARVIVEEYGPEEVLRRLSRGGMPDSRRPLISSPDGYSLHRRMCLLQRLVYILLGDPVVGHHPQRRVGHLGNADPARFQLVAQHSRATA